jgi:ParB-like chromosome segregation protein Spo0J
MQRNSAGEHDGRAPQRRSELSHPNPHNPPRTPVPQAMENQLLASVTAIGIIQPPNVKEADDQLVVIAGNRRVKAAITAGFSHIDVVVAGADDTGGSPRRLVAVQRRE